MMYIPYHTHTELSLLDSCSNYKDYVDFCVENNIPAICFTEHGNIYQHFAKRQYCKSKGIKYLHGCEVYLTQKLEPKVRDNYHTILIAKDMQGFKEMNTLITRSSDDEHFYFKPRISFDEFFHISNHIFKISACIQSPLNHKDEIDSITYDRLCNAYDYFEIQYHNVDIQKSYNKYLYELSKKYNKPLIAAGDSHSVSKYKAECRKILLQSKDKSYGNEDTFDLVIKTPDEFNNAFYAQNVLPKDVYDIAIQNTIEMANTCKEITDDYEIKYPKVSDNDELELRQVIAKCYKDKLDKGIITDNIEYKKQIVEEFRVFKKVNMLGFMLGMHKISKWCEENDIPRGFGRGSCCGSTIAFITDITDVDPIIHHTIFSRFCNEYRTEVGDIDLDFAPQDREKVYNHIIEEFGVDKTAYVFSVGTLVEKGTIDDIGRALRKQDEKKYSLDNIAKIKSEYESDKEKTKKKYPELFYYFDGLINSVVSQGFHPAGILISPVTLDDNYGCFYNRDGKKIINLDMEEVHDSGLVKYDILGLKNVGIIKDTCELIDIPYPKSYNVDWDDKKVWDDLKCSPVGVFQFESDFAFQSLKKYNVQSVDDMTLVNACIRPSGATYRDEVFAHHKHTNPSKQIDGILKNSMGQLVYQEQTIAFLQQCCGFSGGEADNIRRAIGRKQKDRLEKAMPQILKGYCERSDKPKEIAEQEAKEFLQVIENSASYQFGFNHATAYSMIGYICGYLRYYYPVEFITAYLNNAGNDNDITNGAKLAKIKGIKIMPIQFGKSSSEYTADSEHNAIYQGIGSIKYCNKQIGKELFDLSKEHKYNNFYELLNDIQNTSVNSKQLDILIKLNFFSEFGMNGRLLKQVELYNTWYNKKQISKSKVPDYIDMSLYSNKETKTQYRELDNIGIIKELDKHIPNKPINPIIQLKTEQEYLGYIHTIYNVSNKFFFVTAFKMYKKPYVTIRQMNTGKELNAKVTSAKLFEKEPFGLYSILKIEQIVKRNKMKKDNDKWIQSDEKELVITDYTMVAFDKKC